MNNVNNFNIQNNINLDLIQLQQNDQIFNPVEAFGPLELNILERVENGLNDTTIEANQNSIPQKQNSQKKMYKGAKEIIYVIGWADIDIIYNKYLLNFLSKIFIGFSILYSLMYCQQSILPISVVLLCISFFYLLMNGFYLVYYRRSNFDVKFVFWIEFQISLCYMIYFLGFFLILMNYISDKFFVIYALPYFILTLVFFFYNSKERNYISQKKFLIFEAIQLLLISFKFSQISLINWNYSLILFMAGAIYLTVLGMLMTIVLSCSLFGFLYNNLIRWKLNSLLWITWYYLWSGMIYIYLIKGVVQFYNEDDIYEHNVFLNYFTYKSENFQIIFMTSIFMITFSAINMFMHIIWKNDIKNFLDKVVYKNETRKEISLRLLSKDFVFPLIQISDFYFSRPDIVKNEKTINEEKNQAELKKDNGNNKTCSSMHMENKDQKCGICYDEISDIFFDPCNHGGMCKGCLIGNLKNLQKKEFLCPFCKTKINKAFLMKYNEEKNQYFVEGEIKFKI